ncbi:MAG: DUF846 domain-containing protein [archaeon]|nr:DUF846 domain-containing protein [archaeon]
MDTNIFWYSMYIYDAFWILFLIWEFIRLNFVWATVCFILCTIALTNTYGFFRCSKQQEGIAISLGKKIFLGALSKN